jgi:hypothetical protein
MAVAVKGDKLSCYPVAIVTLLIYFKNNSPDRIVISLLIKISQYYYKEIYFRLI